MNYSSKSLISICEMTNGSARLVQFFNSNPDSERAERREANISYDASETQESLFAKLNDNQDHMITADGSLRKIVFETV